MQDQPPLKTGLVGFEKFVRHNPKSDRFEMHDFHHVEFICGDAQNVSKRFAIAMGMQQIAKSDQTTGNHHYASYVMRTNNITFVFSAPYSREIDRVGVCCSFAPSLTPLQSKSKPVLPHFNVTVAHEFFVKHGLAANAVAISVTDAVQAYKTATENGAIGVTEPITLLDDAGKAIVSEIKLYGDVVLRFVQTDGYTGPFLPGYVKTEGLPLDYGTLESLHVARLTSLLLTKV
jgi:4-hydroxyphenylpyruvate dioxygenase